MRVGEGLLDCADALGGDRMGLLAESDRSYHVGNMREPDRDDLRSLILSMGIRRDSGERVLGITAQGDHELVRFRLSDLAFSLAWRL